MMAAVWWLGFFAAMAAMIGCCYVGGTHGLYDALGADTREARWRGWGLVAASGVVALALLILAAGFAHNAMFGHLLPAR